jgi:hypothetical protein
MTTALMCFLATWARRLSWRDVASAFGTSWDNWEGRSDRPRSGDEILLPLAGGMRVGRVSSIRS